MKENKDPVASDLWQRGKAIYLSTLLDETEKAQAERYFDMVSRVTLENGLFSVFTANSMAADFLKENYSEKLKNSIALANGPQDIAMSFKRDDSQAKPVIANISSQPNVEPSKFPPSSKASKFISTIPLEENYTFEEFVQGPSNSWAYAAAKGVSIHPGKINYNPLFIHGGTGLGKTHLMQAIGNDIHSKNPSMSICYITAEIFLNEYINCLQKNEMESFRNRYRNVDVLLVDDIQFLQKGQRCQEEFFNTFNFLKSRHKQIVMTSDVAPKNLPALEERLISRFEGGMVQEIEAPGYETRLAILKKKAEGLTPTIPLETLQFLADNIKSHVRAMEGALAKVHVTTQLQPTINLTPDFLSVILKDVIEKEQSLKKLSISEIQESVARKYSVTVKQILSSDRTSSLVTPRQLAMYIARKYTTKSLQEIAAEFEKKHPTINHGVKTIEKRMDVEPELKASLESILNEFGYKITDSLE